MVCKSFWYLWKMIKDSHVSTKIQDNLASNSFPFGFRWVLLIGWLEDAGGSHEVLDVLS